MIDVRNVWILLRNDIQLSVRNWTILFLVGMPLVLSLVMRVVLSAAPSQAKAAIVGADQSKFLEIIIQSGLFEVSDKFTGNEARLALQKGDLNVVIVLPADVDAKIEAGGVPEVLLLVDEAGQTQAAMAEHAIRELARAYAGQRVPIALKVEPIRGITRQQGILPNWMAMMLVMGITILPTALAMEKQSKTLDALLVTPLSYLDVVIGKSLNAMLWASFGALLILAVNGGLRGNLPLVGIVMVLGSASTVSIGLFIGLLSDSVEKASQISSIVLIPVIWSAFFAEFRGPVGTVSKLLPGYHISQSILHAMFTQGTFASEWVHLVVLATFALLGAVGCVWALSRREL